MKLSETLDNILRSMTDIQSLLIVDNDGVPIISAGWFLLTLILISFSFFLGNEIRNRAQLTVAFMSSLEQARKLNMGEQKSWVFHYETYQLVILNMQPVAVFIIASPSANTALLCQLRSRLVPVLDECKKIIAEVKTA